MDKIEILKKKIDEMVEKYNLKYESEDSMANDLLDMAEGIMSHQSMLIKLYRKQNDVDLVEKPIIIEDYVTEKRVTWQEAFKAGLEGKKIKVYGQYLTYPKFETLHFALVYLSYRPNYYQDLLKKEWYIEKA